MLKFEGELPLGQELEEDLPFAEEIDTGEQQGWHMAPEASHVDSFRYLDADPPEIQVKFKNGGAYRYKFASGQQDYAKIIWEEMAPATHPGIVIWHWLIRGGVPYERMG